MSIKTWGSLAFRTGALILASATVLSLLLSFFFYQRTYHEQLATADTQLQQLFNTVEDSAAIAAYLSNNEIALEVATGLASNDIVSAAQVKSTAGLHEHSGTTLDPAAPDSRTFTLYSPFVPEDTVGTITMLPNHSLIKSNAQNAAWRHVEIMLAHSLVLVILSIVLVHRNLSSPIRAVSQRLHTIPPGSDARLQCPKHHHHDEIGMLIKDTNGLLDATQGTLNEERRLREYAESLERQFRLIFDHASCGIALVNPEGRILLHNPSFSQVMSQDEQQNMMQKPFYDLFANPGKVRMLLNTAAEVGTPVNSDLQLLQLPNQRPRWLNGLISRVTDETDGIVLECILYDVSERTRREQQTRFEADRDPLTELYNRRAGYRQIESALQRSKKSGTECALMLIDLDRFKPINDLYGHEAGDLVLKEVAERLRGCLRSNDCIIRWGGDEFVVVVDNISDPTPVAKKILISLHEHIHVGNGVRDQIGASIGIAMFPKQGQKLEDLIHYADQAMYEVKNSGRDSFAIYERQTLS